MLECPYRGTTHRYWSIDLVRAASTILAVVLLLVSSRPLLATRRASRSHDAGPIARASKNLVDPTIKLRALWDGRKSVDFQAADNPQMVPANHAHFLQDDEYVLGLTINGESRAYPTRFLAWHHIINDVAGKADRGGKAFVTVTY